MNPSIELIRLSAVILIVFTHTRNDLDTGTLYFIIEKLPTFGTAILSIISGFLYIKVSQHKQNIIKRKIKSLLIPYLIANVSVLLLVLFFNYVLKYNALNRLDFNMSLITEGIFSLTQPPINPPTYFIRDIFVLFSIITLISKKEYISLFFIIPLLIFGTLILRLDVAILFLIGCGYGLIKEQVSKKILISITILSTIFIGIFSPAYLKFPVALLVFISLVDINVKLFHTGRYSYLLHLYHSPIIVITYPIVNAYIDNIILKLICQIMIAITTTYFLFLLTKRYKFLKILSGGR